MEQQTKTENGHKSPEAVNKETEAEKHTSKMNGDGHEKMSDSDCGDVDDESNTETNKAVEDPMADLEKKVLNDNDSTADGDNSMPMDTSVDDNE